MKNLKILLTGLLLVWVGALSYAQTSRVTGAVTDASTGEAIPFASVLLKGTTVGTATDSQGQYVINVPQEGTLVFSFIGFATVEVPLDGRREINVSLTSDAVHLEDLLVIAYGTAKKESFTGSAQVVKSDKIERRTVANVTKALDGMAAGVQTTSGSGQPGAGASVIIRGFGSISASRTPLYVVDGIPYDGNINAINPNDIESMTIIKDASAGALYGARGANGVVMITTKRGSEGRLNISFKGNWGVASRAIPRYETMDAYEWTEDLYFIYKDKFITGGMAPSVAGPAALQEMATGPTRVFGARQQYNPFSRPVNELIDHTTGKIYEGTTLKWDEDWLDLATADSPLRQEYQMIVSGGTDRTNHMFSVGYLKEEGLVRLTNFQRFSGRANIDSQVKEWFRTGLNVNFAGNTSNSTTLGSDATSNTTYSNVFYSAMMMAPVFPVYLKDDAGNTIFDDNNVALYDWGEDRPAGANAGWNPLANLEEDKYVGTTDNLSGRTFIELGNLKDGPLRGLKLSANFGFDYRLSKSSTYYNPYFGNAVSLGGLLGKADGRTFSYTFNQLLTWDRTFGDHHFDILAGHEFYKYNYQYLYGEKAGFPFGGLFELAAATNIRNANSYENNYAIESYLTRVNYDYADRYYFSASYRKDGSSRFKDDVRWGDFWSVGASWRISEESFMESADWLNNLTLKASYGVQGNDNIGSLYAWQAFYSLAYPNASMSGALVSSLENPELRWEKNQNLNVGIEGRFADRYSLTLEYYHRKTSDMLMNFPMALSLGFDGYDKNVGSMENSGVELTLSVDVFKRQNFHWNTVFMGSTVRNKVLQLADKPEIVSGNYIIKEGETLNSYYLSESAGVDPATGKKLYWVWDEVDGERGEKYISSSQQKALTCKEVVGSRIPDLYGSWSNDLRYKNFDLSVMTTYSLGGKMLDGVYSSLVFHSYVGNTGHKDRITKSWRKPGDIAQFPKIEEGGSFNVARTSDELIDASYFAVKNITLGYSLPRRVIQKMKLDGVRFTVTADNLHIFTALKGIDPQYNFSGGTGYTYTPQRTISLGIDIKF